MDSEYYNNLRHLPAVITTHAQSP